MYDVQSTARNLAILDAAMRIEQGQLRAVSARFRFYVEAVRTFSIRRLNSLGSRVSASPLSDRSLDLIFDDYRYSEDVVTEIVRLAERDAVFRAALVEQEGACLLAYWRKRVARTHFDQVAPIAA